MENLLNLLPQFILLGSIWWFITSVVIFFMFLFIAESKENGFIAFFGFLIFSIVNYYWGDFNVLAYFSWANIGAYFGIGLVYALFKTYVYAKKQRAKSLTDEHTSYKYKRERAIEDLKGNVFRWWFIWPISLVYWIFSDLFRDIWAFLWGKVSIFFTSIFDWGFGKPTDAEIKYENRNRLPFL